MRRPPAVLACRRADINRERIVERSIAGYHQDEEANWVAELDCGHNQHLYHRPPFQVRPWVLEVSTRADNLDDRSTALSVMAPSYQS